MNMNASFAKNLSFDQAIQFCPSLTATHAHESRSSNYKFIPTADIVEALLSKGFSIASVRKQRVLDASRKGFERHQLRLRQANQEVRLGDVFPEVVLTNSHDGTSGFRLDAGLFRLACSNGMTVNVGTSAAISVPHRGNDVYDRVIEGSYEVVDIAENSIKRATTWDQVLLTRDEQRALAGAAAGLRFDTDARGNLPITADQLLLPKRYEDREPTLWRTFNMIQEHLVKGGVRAIGSTGRRIRTREVTGIDASDKLNRALWTLGEHMAQLKGAA